MPKKKQTEEQKKVIANDAYNPSDADQTVIKSVYANLDYMIDRRNETYREFNDKTLKNYIDASEKRLNSYTLSREAQGKEDWQSNVALPTVRNKVKRLLAGYALTEPDVEMKAVKNYNASAALPPIDPDRAEIAKYLVKASYTQEENPVLANFWESWEVASKGTGVVYEGYLKTRIKQPFIKSFDPVTGVIEEEEREVDVDDKCISVIVPLTEMYIWDFYVHDIQDQPRIAWVRYIDKELFEYEFGHYANAKFVKTKAGSDRADTSSFYYQQKWVKRVRDNQVELIKEYDTIKKRYRVVANGVLILNAPLLWRKNGVAVIPFAKTICEPFVNKNFFYGKSFPDILAGLYDTHNTLMNTDIDKQYRSLVKPMIVGRVNQEALDLEDEYVTGSTKITVDDVNQIKQMEIEGISNGDVAMIKLIAQEIEDAAPSIPGILSGKGKVTAREVVIAEEKLQEIKTMYHEMMVDLWLQKYGLRLANIQQNYPLPRKITETNAKGEIVEKEVFRTFIIENAILDKKTNERGILAIQFRKVNPRSRKKVQNDVDVEEEMMAKMGINYKKMILPPDHLDNYSYPMNIISGSLSRESMAKMQAVTLEKFTYIQKFFPQMFVMNQEDYWRDFAKAYGDNPDLGLARMAKFKADVEQMRQGQAGGPGGAPGAPQGQPAGAGSAAPAPQAQ